MVEKAGIINVLSVMKYREQVVLVCSPLHFYTEVDEELLFQWLKAVSCIQNIKGVGKELQLHIANSVISYDDLLNLIGIFERYKFDIQQLLVFKNENNKDLFEVE
jgi:hypothetical protein